MSERAPAFAEDAAENPTLQYQECAMEKAPQDEVPTSTMPETAERENQEKINTCSKCPTSAAAQGNIEVIAEPGGERNMPSLPEVAKGAGNIGVMEID